MLEHIYKLYLHNMMYMFIYVVFSVVCLILQNNTGKDLKTAGVPSCPLSEPISFKYHYMGSS